MGGKGNQVEEEEGELCISDPSNYTDRVLLRSLTLLASHDFANLLPFTI